LTIDGEVAGHPVKLPMIEINTIGVCWPRRSHTRECYASVDGNLML